VAVVVLFLIAGGLTAFFLLRGRAERDRTERYKRVAESDWNGMADGAQGVVEALSGLRSSSDLDILRNAAEKLRDVASRVQKRASTGKTGPSFAGTAGKEAEAAGSIRDYASLVAELAASKDGAKITSGGSLLESLGAKARRDVTDFLSAAPFVDFTVNGDFYQAAEAMEKSLAAPGSAVDPAERQAVYEKVNDFMAADTRNLDIDTIWSLLSSRLHSVLAALKITRDQLSAQMRSSTSGPQPVDYYVSSGSIELTSGTMATARAIVYYDSGPPGIGDVQLVKEADGWKIDNFPFGGPL
jgi:hypothetical protein